MEARPPKDAVLALVPGSSGPDVPILRVYLSCQPETGRLHLQHDRLQRHTGPEGPFYQRLSAELTGAELRRVQQVRGDRLVLFEFQAEAGRRALLLELTGRHANMVLLGKGDEVLDVLVPAPKKRQHTRLVIGQAWSPPPGRPGDEEAASLEAEFPLPDELPLSVQRGHEHRAPLSYRVEHALGPRAAALEADTLRRDILRRLERRLSRTSSALKGLNKREEAAAGAERVRQDGELLKAAQGEVPRGAESVELVDYFDEAARPRVISLDPKLSAGENAEKYFTRYKKLLRSSDGIAEERARHEEKAAALSDLIQRLEAGEEDPSELEEEAVRGGLLEVRQEGDERKRKAPAKRLPYKVFTAARGSEVRVGRSARDNDALTFRHAKGNDLWLHTADAPGSHVVLCTQGKGSPDPEELLDAATLAVHFSPLREATRADVHTARVKEVKKPRGAKPGLVTLSGGKTLHVRMQPDRLGRLLSREGPAPSPPGT
ncbi:MAG: NFACT family protein [Planctomycetes bacterium]|nr:NFACT family protein [Planctomycetota bacterium]